MTRSNNQRGFTIIELLIATTIFSIVLLVITGAVVQIGRLFYKGMTASRAQEVSRSVLDDISRAIQYTPGVIKEVCPPGPLPTDPPDCAHKDTKGEGICIGQRRYSFVLGKQLGRDSGAKAFISDSPTGSCDTSQDLSVAGSASGNELLADKMRLSNFSVTRVGNSQQVEIADGNNATVTFDALRGDADPSDGIRDDEYPWSVTGGYEDEIIDPVTGQKKPVGATHVSGHILVGCPTSPNQVISNVIVQVTQCATVGLGIPDGKAQIRITNPSDPKHKTIKYTAVFGSAEKFKLNLRVVYGDDDLLCTESLAGVSSGATCDNAIPLSTSELSSRRDLKCKNRNSGTQFCAMSELSTIVERRL